jgi:hypothetical protein
MTVPVTVGAVLLGLLPSVAGAVGISLEKTVIKTGQICPGVTALNVAPGTLVSYCYKVTNNDSITYTTHSLSDSVLGPITLPPMISLPPPPQTNYYSTAPVPNPSPIITDVTNVATWTAMSGTTKAMATDTAQVYVGPANDLCISATTVPTGGLMGPNFPMETLTTDAISRATTEGQACDLSPSCGSQCAGGGILHSVWYEVTAPKAGTLCAQTCGSGYDTVLTAYNTCQCDGDACAAAASELACNNNFANCGPSGTGSAISLPVTTNETVYIRVSSCGTNAVGNMKLTVGYCGVGLTKTVSKDGNCPGVEQLSVPSGTTVTYCYKATNLGPITLTVHSLQDSVLGTILNMNSHDIGPGDDYSPIIKQTKKIYADTTNVATWTAGITTTLGPAIFNPVSDTDSAQVFICGDGVTEGPETCDDHNTVDGTASNKDCCTSMCMNRPGGCEEGNLCTIGDTCQAGVCVPGTPKDCSALKVDECNTGMCDPSDGNCKTQALTGTPCVNGTTGTPPVTCFSTQGTCDSGKCIVTAVDTDKDGICDDDDKRPSQFDPSGYFYDESTGRIVPGGHVGINRIGGGTSGMAMVLFDGSTGLYQYILKNLTDTPEYWRLTITAPPHCFLSPTCLPEAGAYDPDPGAGNPNVLGAYTDPGNPKFLKPFTCPANPFYTDFVFESGDPDVINNNIPVTCVTTPAPLMSLWGLVAMFVVLAALGFWSLRRKHAALN